MTATDPNTKSLHSRSDNALPVTIMPFLKSSCLSNVKVYFGRVIGLFRRKISVTEMTEAPHPSLDDFLARRGTDQNVDDESTLSMCSTCHERMQGYVDKPSAAANNRVDSAVNISPVSGISQMSLVWVSEGESASRASRPVDTTSVRRQSSATKSPATSTQVFEVESEFKNTIIASPSALAKAFRACIPTHPALVDLLPPFNRHSDPTYQQGPARRAEIVRQASQQALTRRCSDLSNEADQLAERLQDTEKELSDAKLQLESALDELAARESVKKDLRDQCSGLRNQSVELKETAAYRLRQYNILHLAFQDLQVSMARHSRQEQTDRERIQTLLSCRRHRHCKLRYDILHLSEQLNDATAKLRDLEGIQYKHDILQYELRALHQSQEEQQIEHDRLEIQLQRYQNQNEALGIQVQQLLSQRSSEEDIEATQVAEREVYVMHERLKAAEWELKQRRTSLDVVRQNNRDLSVEIACLKYRLVDKKDVRKTV